MAEKKASKGKGKAHVVWGRDEPKHKEPRPGAIDTMDVHSVGFTESNGQLLEELTGGQVGNRIREVCRACRKQTVDKGYDSDFGPSSDRSLFFRMRKKSKNGELW